MEYHDDDTDRIVISPLTDPVEVAELLALFENVAADEGWQPGTALRSYLGAAHHLAAHEAGTLVGGVQVVLPDGDGALPYETLWPEISVLRPCHTAHITVLAFREPYRGHPALFWSVCAELWRYLVGENMEAVLLEATPAMQRRYCRIGFPLEIVGELRPHWGEDCYLCRMDLRTVAGAMLMQAGKSPIYRTLVGKAARSKRQSASISRSTQP